jgi:ATP-dependent Clp protease ATP-binding subunit ClpA
MFERFTDQARAAVVAAQDEARSLGHGWIGTEHLLLGLLADGDSSVTRRLGELGLTHDAVRAQVLGEIGPGRVDDTDALRDIGIDLEAVRRRVEDRFGPGALDRAALRRSGRRRWLGRRRRRCSDDPPSGHIPFCAPAKKSLELALREAVAAGSREIRAEHLALGLMRSEGLVVRIVTALGVTPDAVRRVVRDPGRAA